MRLPGTRLLAVIVPLMMGCAQPGGGTSANGAFHNTSETWAELLSLRCTSKTLKVDPPHIKGVVDLARRKGLRVR